MFPSPPTVAGRLATEMLMFYQILSLRQISYLFFEERLAMTELELEWAMSSPQRRERLVEPGRKETMRNLLLVGNRHLTPDFPTVESDEHF